MNDSNFCRSILKKRNFFFDHFRDRVFLGINLEIYIYETSFSKSRKKRTFCNFQWRIGVRFFFHEYWKNAPQFVTENRPKYSTFCCTISKKRTFFLIILGIGSFWRSPLWFICMKLFFSKSRKKRTFCDFQWRRYFR